MSQCQCKTKGGVGPQCSRIVESDLCAQHKKNCEFRVNQKTALVPIKNPPLVPIIPPQKQLLKPIKKITLKPIQKPLKAPDADICQVPSKKLLGQYDYQAFLDFLKQKEPEKLQIDWEHMGEELPNLHKIRRSVRNAYLNYGPQKNLDQYLDIYIKNIQNPKFFGAINFYTFQGDLLINTYLRGHLKGEALNILVDRYDLTPSKLCAQVHQFVDNLDQCMDSLPKNIEQPLVYRGMSLGQLSLKVGDQVPYFYDAYTSTTFDIDVAFRFKDPDQCCLFEIYLPPNANGIYLDPLSQVQGEKEFLLSPGYLFDVFEIRTAIIAREEVPVYVLVPTNIEHNQQLKHLISQKREALEKYKEESLLRKIQDHHQDHERNLELEQSALDGNLSRCLILKEQGADNFEGMLEAAAMGNHFDLCQKAIEWAKGFGISLDTMLRGAARGGHQTLCEKAIEMGAKNLDEMLFGAAQGNRNDLCEIVIKKGASISAMLNGAALGGHKNLCEKAKTLGARDILMMLYHAAKGGHKEICLLAKSWRGRPIGDPMIEREINHTYGNMMLRGATEGGHLELCELAKEWGAVNFDRMLELAIQIGHLGLVKLAIKWGAKV